MLQEEHETTRAVADGGTEATGDEVPVSRLTVALERPVAATCV